MDLLVLYLLGVNVLGVFRKILDEVKSLFGNKNKATEDTEGTERK